MKRPRLLRLLPAIIALGSALLIFKTTDLVHAAYGQDSGQAAAQDDGQSASTSADPSQSGGAAPAPRDFAGDDDPVASASTVDVTNDLARRRRQLDGREVQLNAQANMIAAAEARVDTKISELKQLQSQIASLLGQHDEAQKAQIASLVKTYSTMKAKDAARIFDTLPDAVAVPVAQQMKSDVLAQLLAAMSSDNAKALTVKLATRLTLPQTTDAPAPAPASDIKSPPARARNQAKT